MNLRHLRGFLVLAEELHFVRAADRLHIEQSPLSRAIKELEEDLGAQLFVRNRRGTRLTAAGQMFLEDVRRVFTTLELARSNVIAVASGYWGTLQIAVSDGAAEPRLSTWLARCREEEVRLVEVPLAEQLRGLREGHFDAGLARTDDVGDDISAWAVWHDPLMLVVPARHPLLVYYRVPWEELARFPLVTDPEACEGFSRQLTRLLRTLGDEPILTEQAGSLDMMLTLVAAGYYGLGFVTAAQVATCRHSGVVVRPIMDNAPPVLTTYVLRLEKNGSEQLDRFIARLTTDQEEKRLQQCAAL